MNEYEILKEALNIATDAHEGQTDKAGQPYLSHPVMVALQCGSTIAKAVGLLHDTLEDHPEKVNYAMLCERVGKDVADAVQLLTNDGTRGDYLFYVQSIIDSGNRIAMEVKRADLLNNMDLTRIKEPGARDYQRIEEKYRPALVMIEKALFTESVFSEKEFSKTGISVK